ncbi:xanthine dehydrogenase accessory protein XdhC [Shumkonia mesophila]|uniref:xanthine dehydrogenase accessory protein XdhC n=1 Tax=Shumkonia mesophila TaxID=2838854 RepID=UPI002934B1EE|nr:xanthine dehydrogenase accessory protein XdhC [Shumkonia mesophila]
MHDRDSKQADWRQALIDLEAQGIPHVLVTLVAAQGSTPRAAGTKMVVTADGQADTIGGGTLEHQAIDRARRLLAEGAAEPILEKQILGIEQDQCCGGATTLLFEPLMVPTLRLALFGAGHVGRALVRLLEGTDTYVLWIDERPELLNEPLPGRTPLRIVTDPAAEVAALPAGMHVRVMTHSHSRDFEIIDALLARDDLASIGLIGSKSKWANFRSRLRRMGVPDDALEAVICPIGLPGVGGKRPAEIAISVAAELLSLRSS